MRYAFTTLSYIVGFPITKWNIVYDINKREVWYRTADSTATKHITMSKLDLSCESSYRMLDVNEKIAGVRADAIRFITWNRAIGTA